MSRLVHITTTDMSLDWLLRPQLEAFADAGYEVIGMSAPGPHVASLRASGIEHESIPALTRSMSPRRDILAFRQMTSALRRLRPHIVHTHNPKPGLLGRLAARASGVPVVVNTVHGLYATPDDPLLKRTVVYGLERLASSCSQAELLQSPEDLPVMRRLGIPHGQLTVLGNGVDLTRFDPEPSGSMGRARVRESLGIDDSTAIVGVVGRLVWEKGYAAVFDAASRLDDLDCVFVVVGPEEPEKSSAVGRGARARAEESGLRFLGARDDIEDVYRAFDLYVLASHREGFPRSAMEASAMGLPIVATDIRGCRQVVDDGVTGSLVPVDDGESLAVAVARLVNDPELRARQGAAARAKALAEFDDRRVVDTTLRTYEWLLRRGSVGLVTIS